MLLTLQSFTCEPVTIEFSYSIQETLHWFSSQLIPRLNHKQEVVSVLSSTQDITEEKSIFDQLQLNEEHLKT